MSSAKGRLEEGGAEHLDPAFAHLGVALPLAALAQARVVAHKGLESCGDFAIASGVQKLGGQPGQGLGGVHWSKAGDGFNERLGFLIHARAGELCDLLIELVQTRFDGSNRLEQSHQGWTTGRGQIGSAIESAARVLRAAAFGRTIQFFSKVQRRLPAMAAGVGAWMSNWRIPTPSNWSSPPNS